LRLTHEFYRALNKALLSNSSLKVLCLNDTDVGDKGIAMLLPGIKEHAMLSRLQLCNTNITDVGGRQVVEMLSMLPSLVFREEDLGFRLPSLGLREEDLGFRVQVCGRDAHQVFVLSTERLTVRADEQPGRP
jgi:hypothetical protein